MTLTPQQRAKRVARRCLLCGESDYAALDAHRIVPGATGGKYAAANIVSMCANCHRKVHDGSVVIDRWYPSTNGRVLRYTENGDERWAFERPGR